MTLTTLTYNPKVKADLHTKCQGRESNVSGLRVLADGQADGRYQAHYLFALLNYTVVKIVGADVFVIFAIKHSGNTRKIEDAEILDIYVTCI